MMQHLILAAVFASALAVPHAAPADEAVETRFQDSGSPVVIAHRSAEMGGLPENSLAWIAYAIEHGIDMVHINPQLTADDGYVLMHDSTLNRTTDVERVFPDGPAGGPTRDQRGGKDYVRDYTLDEIRRLRLQDGADSGRHPVPTLDEALEVAAGRVLVLLGLKTYKIDSLAATLARHDTGNVLLSDLYFSGTDQGMLRDLSDATGIRVSVSLFRSRDFVKDLEEISDQLGPRLAMVSVKSAGMTPEFLSTLEELGLLLAASGWEGPEDSALLNSGDPAPWRAALENADAALTDRPEMVLEILGR